MKRAAVPSVSRSLELYLREIRRYRVLTAAEERELARTSRPALVTANLRFVVRIAREYASCGLKLGDLIQEGNLGLMKAVERFDPDRGVRLVTYAAWWIRAFMMDHLLRSHSLVKIGTTCAQRRLFFALARTRRRLERESGEPIAGAGDDGFGRIADALGVKTSDVEEMSARLSARELSLDAHPFDEGGSLLDALAADAPPHDELLSQAEERWRLRSRVVGALAALDARERHLIEQRVLGEEPPSLKEIGAVLGVSCERARQLEARARRKLEAALRDLAA